MSGYGSIKRAILIIMILFPLIPLACILGLGFWYFKTSIETHTLSHMKRIVSDQRYMIESFLAERKADLEFIGRSYSFEELCAPGKLDQIFNKLQNDRRPFTDLGVFNEEGVHVAYSGPYELTGKNYKDTDWFKSTLQNHFFISDVFLGYRNSPHFIMAILIHDMKGRWLIRATIDNFTFDTLVNDIRIGKTGEAYIVSAQGVLQTPRRSGGSFLEPVGETIRKPSSIQDIPTFIQTDPSGVDYLCTTAWLNNQSWLLVTRQEKSDVYAILRTTVLLTAVMLLLSGIGVTAVAFFLSDRIIQRIEKIDREKDLLNQQLIGASRLAELGEMAAGFAHEINNPLQIIKNENALMAMTLKELDVRGISGASEAMTELKDAMIQIDLQVSRCSRITQGILNFGRQSEPVPMDLPIEGFIAEVAGMVSQKAAVNGIAVYRDFQAPDMKIHGDPAQLQQVLLNLFNNAMDAILDRHGSSGGKLIIETRESEDARFAEVAITDNGCGIAAENLQKVFSPFFTTKPLGKGTGLGLSVCYGIITKMGGDISVSSTPGEGTRFLVRLPAAAV